ncbi:hypothetical protein RchiOBHm_Chr4g0385041 [Rosa chinensis]|uniref:Uncharacterized protein n=1 Tax=Rosa chinensis TaxID=74649 RepID=A0A2P6QNX1_ROSCH|nr:hypothetical protein RchiOBHm_Chr4g0385041 [Rosa chinensis]
MPTIYDTLDSGFGDHSEAAEQHPLPSVILDDSHAYAIEVAAAAPDHEPEHEPFVHP